MVNKQYFWYKVGGSSGEVVKNLMDIKARSDKSNVYRAVKKFDIAETYNTVGGWKIGGKVIEMNLEFNPQTKTLLTGRFAYDGKGELE